MNILYKKSFLLAAWAILFFCFMTLFPIRSESADLTNLPSLIILPLNAEQQLSEIISSASQSVDIATAKINDPQILDAIRSTAKRGVKVRVILERHPKAAVVDQSYLESQLQEFGAFVRWGNSAAGAMMHSHLIEIDGTLAMVAGFDMTIEALKEGRGFGFITVDPRELSEIQAMYDSDWNLRRYRPLNKNLIWAPDNARGHITDLVRTARTSISIYSESVQDKEFEDALGKAVSKGVMVRVITSSLDNADRPGITRLIQYGCRVKLMAAPKVTGGTILIDEASSAAAIAVGSLDISASSLDEGRGLAVVSRDPGRIRIIRQLFEKDWSQAVNYQ